MLPRQQKGRKTRARCNVCAAMNRNVGASRPRLKYAGAAMNVAALYRSVTDSYHNQDCLHSHLTVTTWCRDQLKCDGTRAETRFRLSAKRTSPFKSVGASVQSNTGSRGVRISGSNAGYTMFRGSVKGTGYPLQPPVSPSLPLPRVTVCHHISTGVYTLTVCSYSNHRPKMRPSEYMPPQIPPTVS